MHGDWPHPAESQCNASLWKVDRITPDANAMCATYIHFLVCFASRLAHNHQARFALSIDKSFQDRGSVSLIKYRDGYEQYRNWLQVGLIQRKVSVVALFKEWNDTIFVRNTAESGTSAGINQAMRELEDNEEAPPSDDEGHQEEQNHEDACSAHGSEEAMIQGSAMYCER
jgi:hypothetical protein